MLEWRPEDSCASRAGEDGATGSGADWATKAGQDGATRSDATTAEPRTSEGAATATPAGEDDGATCSNPQSTSSETARSTGCRLGSGRGIGAAGLGCGTAGCNDGALNAAGSAAGCCAGTGETGNGLPTAAEMRARRSAKLALTAAAGRAGPEAP